MEPRKQTTKVSTHVKAFTHVEAALIALEQKHRDVVHDCKTTAGDKAARQDRLEVQQHITSLEAKRVELTEPYLIAQREIMAIATGFKMRLTTLKTNYDTQIKAEETRKANVKRAAELEAQRKRDEAAAAERAEAARKAQELEAENAKLRAQLAAAKPVQAEEPEPRWSNHPEPVFDGWDRIEADSVPQTIVGMKPLGEVLKIQVPAAHDESLLDLLEAGSAHQNTTAARDTRPVAGFKLPSAQAVADALSEHAKKRTSIRNVCDVLDAIRQLMAD